MRDCIKITTFMLKSPPCASVVSWGGRKPLERCIATAHDGLPQVVEAVHQMGAAHLVDSALESTVVSFPCHVLIPAGQ